MSETNLKDPTATEGCAPLPFSEDYLMDEAKKLRDVLGKMYPRQMVAGCRVDDLFAIVNHYINPNAGMTTDAPTKKGAR